MAEPVWGLLAKAQDDPETIEEAITRLIDAHLADAQAHTEADESLETHKTQSVVDHPELSIVDDKINIQRFSVQSRFESLDGWDITANPWSYLGYMECPTTNVLNNQQSCVCVADDHFTLTPDKTKSPTFETVAVVTGNGNFDARMGMGNLEDDNGVGWKLTKTKVYYLWFNALNEEQLTEIVGMDPDVIHKYRIVIDWEQTIKWFVDEVLVGTLDLTANNIALSQGLMMKFWIKNLEVGFVDKIMSYRVLYEQDL